MSMMGHEVRVMPHKTFRFNLAVCPPYNADFDGGEMNLHVLQSEEARAEARVLMRVQEHILSPRFGGPVIGGIHDHITGSFLLTHKESKFTREEVTYILSKIDIKELTPADVTKGGTEYWSGKALFSAILPKDLSMTFKSSIAPKGDIGLKELKEEDSLVVIKNGVVSSGTIDENAVGAFKGKILDKLARDYGPDAARGFIDKATKMAIGAIMIRGFTTGIDDEDIPEEAKKQIADVLRTAIEKVEGLVESYKRGVLEPHLATLQERGPRRGGEGLREVVLQERASSDGVLLPCDGRAGRPRRHRRPDVPVRLHATPADQRPGGPEGEGGRDRAEHRRHNHPVQVRRGRRGPVAERAGPGRRHR